jgi:hypothetical protein
MINSFGLSNSTLARISYVPELLPDELIYSWIGRLINVNALGYPKECLMQLFGNRNVIPSIDLPTLLVPLHQRLGENSPFNSVNKLLEFGTLYPYHRPFLNSERELAVQNLIFHQDGKGLKVLMGRVANRFGANSPMRFCNICVNEDIENFGTPYWKRYQQLPGINCCLKHQIYLETYVSPKLIQDRQRYILPPYTLYNIQRNNISSSQLDFAKLSRDLLYEGLPSIAPTIRKHIYTKAIIAAGCYTKFHHIDYPSLALCIRKHYNDFSGFDHQQRLLSSAKHPLCWLHTLIDRPDRSSHPICHLLLIGYLFQNIRNFTDIIKAYDQMEIFSDNNNNEKQFICKKAYDSALIRDVTLSCRQVARLMNVSTTTIVCKRRQLNIHINERRKFLSTGLINNINLDLLSGLPLKEIASRNEVSITTVYRLRAQSASPSKSYNESDTKNKYYQKCWLQLIKNNPNSGATSLRNIEPGTYAWLYRHNKDWLQKTNQRLITKNPKILRVNWTERDLFLSNKLCRRISEIKKLDNRPRISNTLMLKILGDAMVRRNLVRLPILKNLLQELTESPYEFQIFRIDRAINTLIKFQKPLQQSRVQRSSNIKKWTPDLSDYTRRKVESLTKI